VKVCLALSGEKQLATVFTTSEHHRK